MLEATAYNYSLIDYPGLHSHDVMKSSIFNGGTSKRHPNSLNAKSLCKVSIFP